MKIKFCYKELNDSVQYVLNIFKNNNIVESDNPDTCICIGGDGTLLYSIYKNTNVNNFILINTGSLGFYDCFDKSNIENLIELINRNALISTKLDMISVYVKTNSKNYKFNALNDFMLRSVNYKSTYFKLFVKDIEFESVVGDGILLSSTYGSSAYNLSLGGPLFFDNSLLSITPVNPIYNKNYKSIKNSILLNRKDNIEIKPFNKTKDIVLVVDGILFKIENVESIKINEKGRKISLLSSKNIDFLQKNRDKLM